MRVLESYSEIVVGENGEQTRLDRQRWIERDDVLTEEQALEQECLAAIELANAEIRTQLAANDAKAIRAVLEGDSERIAAHLAAQAELRAKLQKTNSF